jgi:DNA-directed RNA polymerase subunit E'/Rpb7
MRRYRQVHPTYLKRNRQQQHHRDRKKQILVKSDLWKSLHSGKLVRIRILEESCKERLMRLLPL